MKTGLALPRAAQLALFRVGFYAIIAYECYAELYWVEDVYGEKAKFNFKYPLLPLPTPSVSTIYAILYTCIVSCIAASLGIYFMVFASLSFTTYSYLFLLEAERYNNHYYLTCIILFVFIFTSADRTFALRPQTDEDDEDVPSHEIATFRILFAIVYAYAGIAKLSRDWLSGRTIRALLSSSVAKNPNFLPDTMQMLGEYGVPVTEEVIVGLLTFGGLFLDLFGGPLLLYRTFHTPVLIGLSVFHAMNAKMWHIGIFPYYMLCSLFLFVDSSRFLPISRVKTRGTGKGKSARTPSKPARSATKFAKRPAILTALLLSQALLPLFPIVSCPLCDSAWNRHGFRFSWRMMTKSSQYLSTDFRVSHSGNNYVLNREEITRFMTDRQFESMVEDPEYIYQTAMYIRKTLFDLGVKECRVSADSWIAVNGLPYQRLINPKINLANQPRKLLSPHEFVLPRITKYYSSGWQQVIRDHLLSFQSSGYAIVGPLADHRNMIKTHAIYTTEVTEMQKNASFLLILLDGKAELQVGTDEEQVPERHILRRNVPFHLGFNRQHSVRTLSTSSLWLYAIPPPSTAS